MSQMKILTAWARYRNGEIGKKKRDKLCRAGIVGKAGLGLSAVRRAAVQPEGESGWFKRMIKAMDPRLWKSKKTIKHEAEVEAKRLAQEEADAKKAKAV